MGASLHYFYQDFHHEHKKSLRRHFVSGNSPGHPAGKQVRTHQTPAAGLFLRVLFIGKVLWIKGDLFKEGFMQFLVIGYDGSDDKAQERRMAVRENHLAGVVRMKAAGNAVYGVAMLSDQGKMIGSLMVVDFPSRSDVDAWLKSEPYVTGNVWQKIEVFPAQVPPMFLQKD
jgi:uncharacterized protein YciI